MGPPEAGPILRECPDYAAAVRPYFHAAKDAPTAEFVAEAHLHPAFELPPR